MKVTLVSGSHRQNSQSLKVANYLETQALAAGFETTKVIDLVQANIPMWDEGVWQKTPKWQKIWGAISKELQESGAFVIISPEWSGMATPAIKNFLLLCSSQEVGYKPAVLVGVSSTINGTYPISDLKQFGAKNNHLIYSPEHLIVRNVEQIFESEQPVDEHEEVLRSTIHYSFNVLLEMSKALEKVRSSGVLDFKNYPYGM